MEMIRVLIVEDEAMLADIMRMQLENRGYRVVAVVSTSVEALEAVAQESPDIVLMDILLAGNADGIETAEHIRSRFDVPVIYLTALADERLLERARRTGAYGFLLKPFDYSELHSLIQIAFYKHQLEKSMRKADARYRAIVEEQTDIICRFLPDYTLTFVNCACCSFFGEPCEKLIGKNYLQLMPEDEREGIKGRIVLLQEGMQSVAIEHRLLLPATGEVHWLQCTYRRISDKQGRLLEFQVVGRDVSERVRAEAALREAHDQLERRVAERTTALSRAVARLHEEVAERQRAEEALRTQRNLLKTILSSTPDLIFFKDRASLYLAANTAFCDYLGRTEEGIIGKTDFDLFPPEFAEQYVRDDRRVMETSMPLVQDERSSLPGVRRWYQAMKRPVVDEGGRTIGLIGSLRDITERKVAEERIAAALEEKEILLREIHHRVKNNFQIICSLLRLQSRRLRDKDLLEIFRDSENRIISMATVHEKLYWSGRFANVDSGAYIRSLVQYLSRTYETTSRVSVHVDVADIVLSVDIAIPCGLIINELVSNSLKHAFPEGRKGVIQVVLRQGEPRAEEGCAYELLVRDDGIGMPTDVDIRRTDSFGLFLVTTLVEKQLHGTLDVRAQQGTEFAIRFMTTNPLVA